MARYDTIGEGYTRTRREDPKLAARIRQSLGEAQSVVNVGAGAGAYEPADLFVLAVEPSSVMAKQRLAPRVPAVRATAGSLPFHDASVDAAMSVLSVHHWDAEQAQGVRELRRVARGPVVIVTYDVTVSGAMWLMADYLQELAELDRRIFPSMDQFREWLGGTMTVAPLPVSRDTIDWTLGSFWAHPERVLDPAARASTSGFARMPTHVVKRAVAAVQDDLESGAWDAKHGHLRGVDELDVGMRLIVAQP